MANGDHNNNNNNNNEDGEGWTTVRKNSIPSSCRRRRRRRGRNDCSNNNDTNNHHQRISNKDIVSARRGGTSILDWNNYIDDENDGDGITVVHMEALLKQCRQELRESTMWKTITTSGSCLRTYRNDIQCIVCYGIGTFSNTKRTPSGPLWQLAMALEIRDFVRSSDNSSTISDNKSKVPIIPHNDDDECNNSGVGVAIPMHYFEPLMTPKEAVLLKKFGIQIIPNNERGHREIEGTTTTTLFFMPHCPLQLYTNVLHTNWESIQQQQQQRGRNAGPIIIFGNSFTRYIDGNQHHQVLDAGNEKQQSLHILQLLQPYWEEEQLNISREDIRNCSANFERAFNDSSLTYFPSSSASSTRVTIEWPEKPGKYLENQLNDGTGEVL